MDDLIKLKDGNTIQKSMASVLQISLQNLMQKDPIAFYEFVELCRDAKHELFGNTAETLKKYLLIETTNKGNYSVRDEMKTFVANAVEGEGLDMKLVDPVTQGKEQKQNEPKKSTTRNPADFELYKTIRQEIPDAFYQTANELNLNIDRRKGKPEFIPFCNQVNGVFMEEYMGKPLRMWTPWGSHTFTTLSFVARNKAEELQKRLKSKFGSEVVFVDKQPMYALHEVNGKPLPAPEILERRAFLDSDDVEKELAELEIKYQEWLQQQNKAKSESTLKDDGGISR